MKRWLLFPLIFTACTGSKSKISDEAKDHLFVGIAALPSTLDPRQASDADGTRIASLLYSSFVQMGADLKLVGDAATKWAYKNQGLEFELRQGMTFWDGSALQAQDIEYSFQEYRKTESPYARTLADIHSVVVTNISKDAANPALHVRLNLRHDSATLLNDLSSIRIIKAAKTGLPLGTGPFELISQDSNQIHLKSRGSQTHRPSKIPNFVFKVVRDDNTRFLKLLKGELDVLQSDLSLTKVPEIEKQKHLKVYTYPGLSMTYLLLNWRDPILADRSVRKALAQALDIDHIIQHKLMGLARRATSILTPENPYFNSTLKPIPFDLDAAKSLILQKNLVGKTLSLKTSNNQAAVENGRVLVNQLEKTGLKVEQQSFEWGTYYNDIQKGRFQLATMKWVGSANPDIYRSALHSQATPPGRNRGHYRNTHLDQVVDKAAHTLDDTQRRALYLDAQKTVFEDLAYIPLWYEMEVAIVHQRVHGYRPPLNGGYATLLEVFKE